MPGPNKVKITNKRTGEVTSGKSARSAMKRNGVKPEDPENPRSEKAEGDESEMGIPSSDEAQEMPKSSGTSSGGKKSPRKTSVSLDINGLGDFIVYAYSRKGQNLKSLASREIKAISKNARLKEGQFEDLLALSKGDSVMAVPRHIVFAMKEIKGAPLVRQEVRRFVSEVLKRHPVYQHNNLAPVIANLDGAIEPVEAIRVIAKLSQDALGSLSGLEEPKPKDAEALRSNAINCLALWLWESRVQPVNRVIRWLYDGYWSVVAPTDVDPTVSLETVTNITEVPNVGTACAQFKAEADESARRAVALQGRIDSHLAEIEGLRNAVADLEMKVLEREHTIGEIALALEAERSAHANSRVHLGDDREHLRSNLIHLLKREFSLLSEGLQALRKDPPKVRVMDDHAERVLEGLQVAMRNLEEKD